MDWKYSIVFNVTAGLVGDYICALLLEKGISLLQNRKFIKKYAFGIFLIILAGTSLMHGIFPNAGHRFWVCKPEANQVEPR